MINFGDPGKIYLLWIVAAATLLLIIAKRRRRDIMKRFADQSLWPEMVSVSSKRCRDIRVLLLVGAMLLMVIAFMRPQFGFTWREVERKGLDVFIALDVSNSMLAEDLRPNRLERAKMAIYDLLGQLYSDRVGLILFAGEAFTACPLTLDHGGFLLQLEDADTLSVPVGGTSLASAIKEAVRTYEKMKAEGEHKVLLLITDGEDLSGGLKEALALAVEKDLKVFTVGVGTPDGSLIPLSGDNGFLRDEEGNVVLSRLDEETLAEIARRTGGAYVHSRDEAFGLNQIYEEYLSGLKQRQFEERREKDHHERFQIPLFLAFLFLLAEPFIVKHNRGAL